MEQGALDGRGSHRLLTIVLTVLVALNMSQVVVACVGADGHVAIEPAGHDPCARDAHAHGSSAPSTGSEDHDHAHAGSEPCEPCTDIPVCAGAAADSFKPSQVSVDVCMSAHCGMPSASAVPAAEGTLDQELLISLATFFLPLSTVVLQV